MRIINPNSAKPLRMGSQKGSEYGEQGGGETTLSARELDQVCEIYVSCCASTLKYLTVLIMVTFLLQLYWRAVNAERQKEELQQENSEERQPALSERHSVSF